MNSTNKPDFIIFTDGGSRGNPGEAAYGFVVQDGENEIIYQEGKRIGINTNNVAEYSGVVAALQWLVKNVDKDNITVQFFLDSQLVASQLGGLWKIKNENLRSLFFTIKSLEEKLEGKIFYHAIPREKNFAADRMVNLALDHKI
ncbi:MAG: hypothetical protein COX79_02590 [Candidatus Levybacteria bacterium CG_4_10_14_0_2_um_filter_36_16]|nr:MAG: hypothetical protein AUK12_04950 [Candidatus Levybacteria bacterium CG2_30_37_29]PIR79223.1 MAG: hypothetical protein COU26_02240 [Candidatus Levybacteria bacterium CG10_big_fil_rev_8_21_14_0_10_36_30]PIZ97368.1 MAG: hypothetical protein COX79_02590 [Candidatus Levybacteria bacterium CG_4_10_14_0_2_um_filter_36_16]PJA90893.1 MAG: hypothetical protein CO136_00190 [Candidatus Levybacteria bacterium CG_4_9_14_3_um_filter_36_7]